MSYDEIYYTHNNFLCEKFCLQYKDDDKHVFIHFERALATEKSFINISFKANSEVGKVENINHSSSHNMLSTFLFSLLKLIPMMCKRLALL
jgi:hypothetical protein